MIQTADVNKITALPPGTPKAGSTIEHDPRWAAVVARDRSADGTFYYSVRTTGVYCRPSCGARRANPGNVRFHSTAAEAERDGIPPLQAVQARSSHRSTAARRRSRDVCRLIEAAETRAEPGGARQGRGPQPPSLPSRVQGRDRVDAAKYAAAHRARRVRHELRRSATVTNAIYDAGFNSGGRFYAETGSDPRA